MACNHNGEIVFATNQKSPVYSQTQGGIAFRSYGQDELSGAPSSIAVDDCGRCYVVGLHDNYDIYAFDKNGKCLNNWRFGVYGVCSLSGVAARGEEIFVCESVNQRIKVKLSPDFCQTHIHRFKNGHCVV
jgi:hypothetical protein